MTNYEEKLKKGCGKKLNPVSDVIIKCGEYVMSWDRIEYCSECSEKLEKFLKKQTSKIRKFKTGATRNSEEGKNDYEGFLSPLVIEAFGNYMTKHRTQADGKLRDSDNWQKGMSKDVYIKSAWRHFLDLWKEHRGLKSREGFDEAICGLLFNCQGYYHEYLKSKII